MYLILVIPYIIYINIYQQMYNNKIKSLLQGIKYFYMFRRQEVIFSELQSQKGTGTTRQILY